MEIKYTWISPILASGVHCLLLPVTVGFAVPSLLLSLQVIEIRRFPRLHDKVVDVVSSLLQSRLSPTNSMVSTTTSFIYVPHLDKLLPNVPNVPDVTGVEIRTKCGVRHFWNFDQISLIIIDRTLTVEWCHSFSWTWKDYGSHYPILTQLKWRAWWNKNFPIHQDGDRQTFSKFLPAVWVFVSENLRCPTAISTSIVPGQ